MPCYSIVLNSVELSVSDHALLIQALDDLNLYMTSDLKSDIRFSDGNYIYSLSDGMLTSEAPDRTISDMRNKIKRNYSHAVIRKTAKKRGWKVKLNKKDKNRLEVIK